VLERHPAIALLVNNAGIPARGRFTEIDAELIERVTRVNYLGGVWCLRAFLPGLQAAGDAHVVNVVSVSGTISFAPAGAYSASKHAQLAFSRSTAALLNGSGIRVHTIMPGFVETEGFPQKAVLRSWLLRRFVIDAPAVARAIANAVDKNKREVTVPWFPYRFVSIAQAVVPGVVSRFIGMSRHRGET
jgi:short-subunit dehydrogenase